MKLTVVGCGNAGSFLNYNQSFLLEEGNEKMLIDCGTKVPLALHNLNIDFKKITHYYVSHGHGDHVGGLEELVFQWYDYIGRPSRYDDPKRSRDYAPILIGNELLKK